MSKNHEENIDTSKEESLEKPSKFRAVSLKTMLESGSHFGHHMMHWNPKMAPYLYGTRNDVHIIDLEETLKMWHDIQRLVEKTTARGGTLLFTGTKHPAREIIRREAERCGFFYMSNKWPGGLLTNFDTIRISVQRMRNYEEFIENAEGENPTIKVTKKEVLKKKLELEKLVTTFRGIREMKALPDLLFVVDLHKDKIAVQEARCLHIPVIGLVDSNADPTSIDYPIPANDDARGTIDLFVSNIAEAALKGRELYQMSMDKIAAENEIKAENYIDSKLK